MGYNGTKKRILLILILLVCFAAVVFIGAEVFQVERITVLGDGSINKDTIVSLSGITYGENIFKLDKEKVRKRLEGNAPFPIVESITIKLPDEVIIAVEERVPVAVIPYLSSYIVIDSNGFILDIVKQSAEASYPVIDGVYITRLTKGSLLEVAASDNYKYKVMIRLLKAISNWDLGTMIKTVDLENPDGIVLITRDDITITMGQAVELDRKLGWLESDAYTEVLNKGEQGVLDVSVPGKAVFHPAPTPDAEQEEENEESHSGNDS